MAELKAIETHYKGFRFRSRLEARWAVFFDAMGIKYLYEPEGYRLSDGTCYLPDFYLPMADQYFEVKGVLHPVDEFKIEQFVKESRKQVVIGFDDFQFSVCSNYVDTGCCGNGFSRENNENSVQRRTCGGMP